MRDKEGILSLQKPAIQSCLLEGPSEEICAYDENWCSWEGNASAVSPCDLPFQVSLIVISNLESAPPKTI